MKIEVRLFAQLREKMPPGADGVAYVDLPEKSTGDDLLKAMDVPRNRPIIYMLNGHREPVETPLKDGDRVGVFPPVGGG